MSYFDGATQKELTLWGGMSASYSPQVVVSKMLGKESVQVRFPRSRRKRIQKKWRKDARYWESRFIPGIYQLPDGTLVMDPVSYEKLQCEMKKPAPPSAQGSDSLFSFFSDLRSMLNRG